MLIIIITGQIAQFLSSEFWVCKSPYTWPLAAASYRTLRAHVKILVISRILEHSEPKCDHTLASAQYFTWRCYSILSTHSILANQFEHYLLLEESHAHWTAKNTITSHMCFNKAATWSKSNYYLQSLVNLMLFWLIIIWCCP